MLHPNRLATATLQPVDFVEREHPQTEGAFWLGRSPFVKGEAGPGGVALGVEDDRHFMLVGGTRGGKGTSFIVPNLCLWPGSVVCVDPKGENAMLTADARSEGRNGHPQAVYVLDPFHAARIENEALRASFNPLWELMEPDPDGEACGQLGDDDYEPAMRPGDDAVDEAETIANAIVVDGDGKDSKSEFWHGSARRMISALILHIISNERFKGRRNLVTVRQLIMSGDEDLLEAFRAAGRKEKATAHQLMWNDIALNMAFDGVIHEDGAFFAEIAMADPEQFSGIMGTAAHHTDFLKSPKLRKILKSSSFRLEELKTSTSGISLYLCLPLRFMKAFHYRWLRMVIGLATQQMEKTHITPKDEAERAAMKNSQCASGHKVLMMLDEFTSLRRMSYLEEALTQYAGAGLKMFFAVQTLDRLKAVYSDGWESFVSQCGVKCFFNADDHFTRKAISDLLGETEVCISSNGVTLTDTTSGGWSTVETTSSGTGGSHALGIGSGQATGDATNWTTGTGGGTGTALARNQGGGSSVGGGSSHGGGSSYGRNSSHGGGQSVSQENYRTLFTGRVKPTKNAWTDTSSTNWQQGENWGVNDNWSENDNWGRQDNWGESRSDTANDNWSKGHGGGRTITENRNRTETGTESWQQGRSNAQGRQGGESHAKAGSVTEQWHKRPLFLPEEVGRFFAGKDKKQDERYPGLALVVVGGDQSMVVRRVNYYEDERFDGLFNPHRDYPFLPRQKPVAAILPPVAEPVTLSLPAPRQPDWFKFIPYGVAAAVALIAFGIGSFYIGPVALIGWIGSALLWIAGLSVAVIGITIFVVVLKEVEKWDRAKRRKAAGLPPIEPYQPPPKSETQLYFDKYEKRMREERKQERRARWGF